MSPTMAPLVALMALMLYTAFVLWFYSMIGSWGAAPDHQSPTVDQAAPPAVEPQPAPIPTTVGWCKAGHMMTPANTYVYPGGRRICRQCARARRHRRAERV